MKQLSLYLIMLAAALGMTSCVTNNGDIVDLYGVWALDEVTVDGAEYTLWNADGSSTNFEFQNNIVCVQRVTPLHDQSSCWGTWERTSTSIEFNFTHHDDSNAPGTGTYAAPAWFLMPDGVTTAKVVSDTGRRMELTFCGVDGSTVSYRLRKTY